MKSFKSHFVFHKGQRNGIFLLVLIIVALQLIYFFVDFSSEEEMPEVDEEELNAFQQQIDSLKAAEAEADSLKIFPFNPNFITDFKGYSLGMSPKEIDRLREFRQQGRWINSVEDFQKVTGVSDSLLQVISPYFQFPDWVKTGSESTKRKTEARGIAEKAPKKDLNSATAEELQEINGIGEVLSARIVNYRLKIGGFLNEIQLKDVWGLSPEVRSKILAKFAVIQKPRIEILNINKAGVLELSEVPYLNYELARQIVDYRLLHEGIQSFEELAKIDGFPSDKIDRIQLYLALK